MVGNGIFKDGKLHLRDEDIKEIADKQFGEGFRDNLERNGFHTIEFIPFYGDNNFIGGPNVEIKTHAIFAEGERQIQFDYETERVHKLEQFVDRDFLKIDYEKIMGNGIKIEQDSIERLATAIEKAIKLEQSTITDKRERRYNY